jgi:hypothetical protein
LADPWWAVPANLAKWIPTRAGMTECGTPTLRFSTIHGFWV